MNRTAMTFASWNLPTWEENRNKQIHKYDIQISITRVEKIKVSCGPEVRNIFSEEAAFAQDLTNESGPPWEDPGARANSMCGLEGGRPDGWQTVQGRS